MKAEFYKYQGAGNDFIMIDNRKGFFNRENHALVKKLCDRRFGVGADGLILLQDKAGYDFEMVYYNADGNESSLCGNGGRCIAAFAAELGIVKDRTEFLAVDGPHHADVDKHMVSLQMSDVSKIERGEDFYLLNTGSPHYVKLLDSLKMQDFVGLAKAIRYNDRFRAEGVNVNFIAVKDDGIQIRTYERGVEDETLACGTGVVASALAYHVHKNGGVGNHRITVHAVGGELEVSFQYQGKSSFTDIVLKGPAIKVFKGTVDLA